MATPATEDRPAADVPVTDMPIPREAAKVVGEKDPEQITGPEQSAATDWYLSTEPESIASGIIPVNVAPAGHPEHIIDFTVTVVDPDTVRKIRRESISNGVFDDVEFAYKLCGEAIIDPPIRSKAPMATDHPDPVERLKARFMHKPGVIQSIGDVILEVSGFNGQEVKEVKAAGN